MSFLTFFWFRRIGETRVIVEQSLYSYIIVEQSLYSYIIKELILSLREKREGGFIRCKYTIHLRVKSFLSEFFCVINRVSNWNSVERNCLRLRHFIARNCAIITNKEAIKYSRNYAVLRARNCFAKAFPS